MVEELQIPWEIVSKWPAGQVEALMQVRQTVAAYYRAKAEENRTNEQQQRRATGL